MLPAVGKYLKAREIAPLLAYNDFDKSAAGPDIVKMRSIELGAGFSKGKINPWQYREFWFGCNWKNYSAPYISAEYMFADRISNDGSGTPSARLPKAMLNLGVSGAAGFFFIVPLGVNGACGLSSDFNDLYVKYSVGMDFCYFSVSGGQYYNLTKNGPAPTYLNGPFLSAKVMIWNYSLKGKMM